MAICADSLDLGYSCTSPCRAPLARGRSPGQQRQDSKPAAEGSDFTNHKTINTALGPLGFGIAKDLFFFPPSSPLFVFPAAFTLDQLSVPGPSAVAILVDIRGRRRPRPGRLLVRTSNFIDTSPVLNGRDLESQFCSGNILQHAPALDPEFCMPQRMPQRR